MKKILLVSALAVLWIQVNAQIGINTTNPQTALDVNGSIQIRDELRVKGNPGNPGDIYFSKGTVEEAEWKHTDIPFLEEGQYRLVNTYVRKDKVGIDYLGVTPPTTSQTNFLSENFENGSTSRANWTFQTISGNTHWNYDTPGANNNNSSNNNSQRSAQFKGSTAGNSTRLISELFTGIGNKKHIKIGFKYKQQRSYHVSWFSGSYRWNELKLYYRTSTTSPWIQLWSDSSYKENWSTQEVEVLLGTNDSAIQIAFEGIEGNGSHPNMVDNVTITGIEYSYDESHNQYNETLSNVGELIIGKNWKRIPGLDIHALVKSPDNKISMTFQTGVEMYYNPTNGNAAQTAGYTRYMCGVFNRKANEPETAARLIALRSDQMNTTPTKLEKNKSQSIFTLNYTVEEIEVGEHVFSVACRRISTSGDSQKVLLSIGNRVNQQDYIVSDDTLESIFKMDVIELITVTHL